MWVLGLVGHSSFGYMSFKKIEYSCQFFDFEY